LLTGPESGLTRDAIAVPVRWQDVPFRIFDTAGMRKKAKVQGKLEKLSVSDALRAVKFAEVVVLLLDVQNPFETQDLRLADLAEREGRAVVVAVNKWDLEPEKARKLDELQAAFGRLLPQLRGAPLVVVSALTGDGLGRLHEAIVRAYSVWNTRISTARLNRWLSVQAAEHPPPAPGGRRIRLRYMTQVKTRPPTFVLFASVPDAVPEDYRRFLINGLRRDFDMPGTPIRLHLRAGDNPYADRKRARPTALDKHKPRRLEG
jgi:GTP-binding protein